MKKSKKKKTKMTPIIIFSRAHLNNKKASLKLKLVNSVCASGPYDSRPFPNYDAKIK